METMKGYCQLIESLLLQAKGQRSAIKILGEVFEREAERLSRYDQAMRLRGLKARVLYEAGNIREAEATASNASTKMGLGFSAARLALGAFMTNVPSNRDVRWIGKQLLNGDPSRAKPFGTVTVAIRNEGLPDGVAVIPLSRLARESDRSESEVKASLQAEGSFLITAEDFCHLLGKLEKKVLDGTLTLPVTLEQLRSESGLL